MYDLIIHIGYPKTATTSIQEHFFLKLHEQGKINFLGKSHHLARFGNYSSILKNVALKNEKNLSLELFFSQLVTDKLNIVSDEDFPLSFTGIKNQSRLFKCNSLGTIDNLIDIFRGKNINLKFISTIRRQDDLIYSTYVEGYKAYYSKEIDISSYEDYLAKGLARRESGHFLMFYFNKILSGYGRAFGFENVAIALFEDLINDREQFVTDFCKFFPDFKLELTNACLVKENQKRKNLEGYKVHDTLMSDKLSSLLKLAIPVSIVPALREVKTIRYVYHKLIAKTSNIPVAEGFTVPYLTTEQKEKILDFFNCENIDLCENFDLDASKMKEYGYFK